MTELVKCVECGNTVSSEAHKCPHCDKHPRTTYCIFCNKTGKGSEHLSCRDDHIKASSDIKSLCCHVCGDIFSSGDVKISRDCDNYETLESKTCRKCGQYLQFTRCYVCNEIVISDKYYKVCGTERRAGDGDRVCHHSCAKLIRIRRNSDGQCTVCGGTLHLGIIDKLLGETTCSTCRWVAKKRNKHTK